MVDVPVATFPAAVYLGVAGASEEVERACCLGVVQGVPEDMLRGISGEEALLSHWCLEMLDPVDGTAAQVSLRCISTGCSCAAAPRKVATKGVTSIPASAVGKEAESSPRWQPAAPANKVALGVEDTRGEEFPSQNMLPVLAGGRSFSHLRGS